MRGDRFPLLVVVGCGVGDVMFSLELALDLPIQGLLIALHDQEYVGPLLQAPLKKGFVVCRAAHWVLDPVSYDIDCHWRK